MPTATILGTTYQTVIMPDGKEWLASNIRSTLIAGYEVNNDATNRLAYGRLYRRNDIVAATLPEGWRVQTIADVDGLVAAITAAQAPSPAVSASLKSIGTTYWDQAFGTDVYGFGFNGAGWKDAAYPNWYNFRQHGYFAVADPTASKVQYRIISSATGTGEWFNTDSNAYAFSYRLVRDIPRFSGIFPAQSGAWRNASEVHVAKDGVWRKVNRIFVPVSGAWREVL